MKIVSGGQTGVDRAALDVALERGMACGGWCPRGRLSEDGGIPLRYPLWETPSAEYAERTEWNVRDSDGTLVLTWGAPSGGTALTVEIARRLGKPLFVADLRQGVLPGMVAHWLASEGIETLNVAGPRASQSAGVYGMARAFLEAVFGQSAGGS